MVKGVCMAKGVCMVGACVVGVCMTGGVHGRRCAWQVACMVGVMHDREGSMCGRRDGHCSGRYASYCECILVIYCFIVVGSRSYLIRLKSVFSKINRTLKHAIFDLSMILYPWYITVR